MPPRSWHQPQQGLRLFSDMNSHHCSTAMKVYYLSLNFLGRKQDDAVMRLTGIEKHYSRASVTARWLEKKIEDGGME
ncbi:hypothetical protein I305_05265 [Cryptococcus gattii E566]|uniref:Uncharacterized protein n=2 Tax=Cryptococcus gattii TaxID=37769 RepID=E6R7P5_CRYGW|nr:Hypothetical Protein CGB_F1060C [Cryptococcus gattii WM276]ADV22886.1 Hypothetical Protein CGB_F1060C [Cryptococcus gattii WM276]KIR82802.1 hypothetical protein I306_00070 [Cryptococcus gattii EJB2]KIY32309.1 hypothetical protein I305_05265 [Cryptococcus gattii E566]KJE04687.1 hypothetical protein I311_01489 [Cryptococcus gattii NT-10]